MNRVQTSLVARVSEPDMEVRIVDLNRVEKRDLILSDTLSTSLFSET